MNGATYNPSTVMPLLATFPSTGPNVGHLWVVVLAADTTRRHGDPRR